jgi:Flp pilus assembly protein TadG
MTRLPTPSNRQQSRDCPLARRGAVTLWVIAALPVILVAALVLIDVGRIWLGRIELKNALDAAALSAVKTWGESGGGNTLVPRQDAVDTAAANTILGQPVVLGLNYTAGNAPNQNTSCAGDLIFGTLTDDDPAFVYTSCQTPSCLNADITLNAFKDNNGVSTFPRLFGVFYNSGSVNLSIRSISFTIPVFGGVNNNQHPHWVGVNAAGQRPVISITNVSDTLNNNNVTPGSFTGLPGVTSNDVLGMDGGPTIPNGGTPQNSEWTCPNPNGSQICFSFSNPIPTFTDRFRTFTVTFQDGQFNPGDLIRFGPAMAGFNPPAMAGAANDGDAIGQAGVTAAITLFDSNTNLTVGGSATFINTGGDDDLSTAAFNAVGQGGFAVRAQKTQSITSVSSTWFGVPVGPYSVTAHADAFYRCNDPSPRLYWLETLDFQCAAPCP